MELAIAKMSGNGQIVIPMEIRRDAGIKPSTKFLVFNEDGTILLKKIETEELMEEIKLMEKIKRSEEQIKNGRFVKADTKMSEEEINFLLMK